MAGNQQQDEVFLAAQEAVGAHRDSQGKSQLSFEDLSETKTTAFHFFFIGY